jgi:hypothetical protein
LTAVTFGRAPARGERSAQVAGGRDPVGRVLGQAPGNQTGGVCVTCAHPGVREHNPTATNAFPVHGASESGDSQLSPRFIGRDARAIAVLGSSAFDQRRFPRPEK